MSREKDTRFLVIDQKTGVFDVEGVMYG